MNRTLTTLCISGMMMLAASVSSLAQGIPNSAIQSIFGTLNQVNKANQESLEHQRELQKQGQLPLPKIKIPKEELKEMKAAYLYRTDIPKSVLDKTKKWPNKIGILHSDWIENPNGRSIDLQGNEILPDVNYQQLELCCETFFVPTSFGKKGVYDRYTQKEIVPCEFDEIDFSDAAINSIIYCKEKKIGQHDKITIYTTEGTFITKLEDPTLVKCVYFPANYNFIMMFYSLYSDLRIYNMLYYPDGEKAFEEPLCDGKLYPEEAYALFTPKGESTPQKHPYINRDKHHPTLSRISKELAFVQDSVWMENNKWMRMAVEYLNDKRYGDAAFCTDFLYRHELNSLKSKDSEPNYLCYAWSMLAHYLAEDYRTVINSLNGENNWIPRTTKMGFNTSTNTIYATDTKNMLAKNINDLNKWIDHCNFYYRNSIEGLNRQAQERAATTAAIFSGIGNALGNISQGMSSGGGNANRSTTTSTKTTSQQQSSNASSSSSSSDYSGTIRVKATEIKKKCPGKYCNNGTCSECDGTGKKAVEGPNHNRQCTYCNGSGKCTLCQGKGYRIGYE